MFNKFVDTSSQYLNASSLHYDYSNQEASAKKKKRFPMWMVINNQSGSMHQTLHVGRCKSCSDEQDINLVSTF